MKEGRKRVCLLLCLLMILSTCAVFGATSSGEAGIQSISSTSVAFERVKALQGKLTIAAASNTIPDTMYADFMLQKKSTTGTTWTDQWSDYYRVYDTSGVGSLVWIGYINVDTSGAYRVKVYVTEIKGGTTNKVGPVYSPSASL